MFYCHHTPRFSGQCLSSRCLKITPMFLAMSLLTTCLSACLTLACCTNPPPSPLPSPFLTTGWPGHLPKQPLPVHPVCRLPHGGAHGWPWQQGAAAAGGQVRAQLGGEVPGEGRRMQVSTRIPSAVWLYAYITIKLTANQVAICVRSTTTV